MLGVLVSVNASDKCFVRGEDFSFCAVRCSYYKSSYTLAVSSTKNGAGQHEQFSDWLGYSVSLDDRIEIRLANFSEKSFRGESLRIPVPKIELVGQTIEVLSNSSVIIGRLIHPHESFEFVMTADSEHDLFSFSWSFQNIENGMTDRDSLPLSQGARVLISATPGVSSSK